VRVTRFNTALDLIFVRGRIWGPAGESDPLRLVVDTGAAETMIAPAILDELGYGARTHGERITVVRSLVGREQGYLLRVARFSCLGHQADDFRVHAHDLPGGWEIDGLIGLSFLRRLNYEVRSVEGRILAERALP
jgi:predicted aspartyl protease